LTQILISLRTLPPTSKVLPQFLLVLSQSYKNSSTAASSSEEQFARSTFMQAKWGILRLLSERGGMDGVGAKVAKRVAAEVFNALHECVPGVLGDVFNVGFHACRIIVEGGGAEEEDVMEKLLRSMWGFVEESGKGSEKQRMCASICSLVFTGATVSCENVHGPLMRLAKDIMEERKRMPMMGRACAVYVVNALRGGSDDARVRWREWIWELVIHKEEKKNRSDKVEGVETFEIEGYGEYVPETSMSRAIGLSYLEWLGMEVKAGRVGEVVVKEVGEVRRAGQGT